MRYAQLLVSKQQVVDHLPKDVDQEAGRKLDGNIVKAESGS